MKEYEVYIQDREAAKAAVVGGEKIEVMGTEYGHNDHLIDWLKEKGYWEIITGYKAKVGDNGTGVKKLNGIWALMGLGHIGRIQQADPLLRDGKLMSDLGFNLRRKEAVDGKRKGVIHRDTLSNHLKRIDSKESDKVFYEHTKLLRSQKKLRGKEYAADGFEIEVSSMSGYEGAGKVWDDKKKRWKYGYKVVYVFNINSERPRIIGLSLGPIQMDERKLLREILKELGEKVAPVKEIIEVIVLDRGYWGAELFEDLHEVYGLELVTIGIKSHHCTRQVLGMASIAKKWQERRVRRRNNKGKEIEYIRRVTEFTGLEVGDDSNRVYEMNAVLMEETNLETGEVDQVVYFTTLAVARNPYKAVELYDRRWSIENRCNRRLSQEWIEKIPVGRKRNAIYGQLTMIAMLYNVTRIYEEENRKEAEKLREEMQRRGRRSYLLGQSVVIYAIERQVYTTMDEESSCRLIKERSLLKVSRLIEQGEDVREALKKIMAEDDL